MTSQKRFFALGISLSSNGDVLPVTKVRFAPYFIYLKSLLDGNRRAGESLRGVRDRP